MSAFATCAGLMLWIVAPGASRAEEPLTVEDLIGSYTIVAAEDDGRELPAEEVEGNVVRFTLDTVAVFDKDKKEIYLAKYELDTEEQSTQILMVQTGGPVSVEGRKAVGLIKKEGDKVHLIYTVEGGEPPTEFKTKPESKQNLFVLKRDTENET